jgi:hypothetical protein
MGAYFEIASSSSERVSPDVIFVDEGKCFWVLKEVKNVCQEQKFGALCIGEGAICVPGGELRLSAGKFKPGEMW